MAAFNFLRRQPPPYPPSLKAYFIPFPPTYFIKITGKNVLIDCLRLKSLVWNFLEGLKMELIQQNRQSIRVISFVKIKVNFLHVLHVSTNIYNIR